MKSGKLHNRTSRYLDLPFTLWSFLSRAVQLKCVFKVTVQFNIEAVKLRVLPTKKKSGIKRIFFSKWYCYILKS